MIIPAWNSGHCLAETLDSVLAQTFTSWEAIVVDDGSEDDTGAVATRYQSDRIRYLRQDNQGQGAARNRGLAEAHGEFIAFLDADDSWMPAFLDRTVAFLDEHPGAVAVSTAYSVQLPSAGEVLRPECMSRSGKPAGAVVLENFFEFWAAQDHVRTGTVLIRKSVIDEAGPQRADLRISQDLEYWGYIATFGPWGFIPESLWMGGSHVMAARSGNWLGKYRQRRRLCPSVEAWQERILPRIRESERRDFERVRGRVAAGLAHHTILGGNLEQALMIVQRYGSSMPRNVVVRILRVAASIGALPWRAACWLLRTREQAKAMRIQLRARLRNG